MKPISVKNFLLHNGDKLSLKILTGEGGILRNINTNRIVMIKNLKDLKKIKKNTPTIFLSDKFLNDHNTTNLIENLKSRRIALIILGNKASPVKSLIKFCNSRNIPIGKTSMTEDAFLERYPRCLVECSSSIEYKNGVLVDVNGVGILIIGKSSIGKSEVALELIIKGHRLVSDDVVEIFRDEAGEIFGSAPDITAHHMEIRGFGIIDVSKVFGISSIRVRKKIEMVIELVEKKLHQIDRLGEKKMCTIFGKRLPKIIIPVTPGRNIATLIEVAARLYLLERTGYKPLVDFKKTLKQRLTLELR